MLIIKPWVNRFGSEDPEAEIKRSCETVQNHMKKNLQAHRPLMDQISVLHLHLSAEEPGPVTGLEKQLQAS